MACGSGFQLPIGIKKRKEDVDEALRQAGDINEAHLMVFLSKATNPRLIEFYDALDLMEYKEASDMIREDVVREMIRNKINEVVRKKAGGGGYVLYAPNKGKKKHSKPVAAFPTRLAAKRAELARFPPKDPKKLQRLRKEIEKLLKDPKKRAEAERRALKARGTDIHHHAGKARGKHYENKIIAKILVREARKQLNEGLFQKEAKPSQWKDKIKEFPPGVLQSDKKLQKLMNAYQEELGVALKKSFRVVQNELGASGRVKPLGIEKHDDGRPYAKFNIVNADESEVGPIFVYDNDGTLAIEMSDGAKSAVTSKAGRQAGVTIRGSLDHAADKLASMSNLKNIITTIDAYFETLERHVDTRLTKMTPLERAAVKRALVKKFKGKI
jgi:hypothetical protein